MSFEDPDMELTPGVEQKIRVSHVELNEEIKAELNEYFALLYTGQRHLARNLLRDVIGHYGGNEQDSLVDVWDCELVW